MQVSLHASLDPEKHIALGEALAPLRNEDILIIGSGSATHNLRDVKEPGAQAGEASEVFREWVNQLLSVADIRGADVRDQLVHIDRAPHAARWGRCCVI